MNRPEKIALSASLLLLAGVVAFTWLPGMPGNAAGSTKEIVAFNHSTTGRSDAHEPSRRIVPATAEERRARLEAIIGIENGLERKQELLDYLDALSPGLFSETMEICLDRLPNIEEKLLLGAWLKIDAPAALAYGQSQEKHEARSGSNDYRLPLFCRMLMLWAPVDSQSALTWVKANTDGRTRGIALQSLLRGGVLHAPAETLKIAFALGDDGTNANRPLLGILAWGVTGYPEAAAELLKVAGPEREWLAPKIEACEVERLFQREPEKALKMLDGKPEIADLVSSQSLFLRMAGRDSRDTTDLFDSMIPGKLRDTLMSETLSDWLITEPEAAREWLKEHPQSDAITRRLGIHDRDEVE